MIKPGKAGESSGNKPSGSESRQLSIKHYCEPSNQIPYLNHNKIPYRDTVKQFYSPKKSTELVSVPDTLTVINGNDSKKQNFVAQLVSTVTNL
jgi:hypothetical protein